MRPDVAESTRVFHLLEEQLEHEVLPARDAVRNRDSRSKKEDKVFLFPRPLQTAEVALIHKTLADVDFIGRRGRFF